MPTYEHKYSLEALKILIDVSGLSKEELITKVGAKLGKVVEKISVCDCGCEQGCPSSCSDQCATGCYNGCNQGPSGSTGYEEVSNPDPTKGAVRTVQAKGGG